MKKTLCIVLAIVLLSTFLGGCVYDLDDKGGIILLAVPYNIMELGFVDVDVCAEQGFFLVVGVVPEGPYDNLPYLPYYECYRDGQLLGPRLGGWPEGGAAFYPPLPEPEDLGPSDPVHPALLFTPGTYAIEFFEGHESTEVLLRLSVVVPSCSPGSNRSDVSVVIYGAWDGIPVKAYVGGTEQETLYTARDASGEAAVLWTFYPPADESLEVSIEPQTPPGKDSDRWQYKLLRIEGPAAGQVNNEPDSASVSVGPAGQYKLYFQLLDMGPEPGQ